MNSYESIIFRSSLTMGGIVLLALLSMFSSVFIATSSKDDAAAINLAGSLRMQSYRIITRLQQSSNVDSRPLQSVEQEINEFERRLNQLWQMDTLPITESNNHKIFSTINNSWYNTLKPTLKTLAAGDPTPTNYLQRVDDFVKTLDEFVKLLEQNTKAKMLLLRLVQGVALVMILALILIAMYQLQTSVITPLRDLVKLANKARQGDLTVRSNHTGNDELGILGRAFNRMTIDLSVLYANLKAQVERQTQALQISNRSLELLYHTTHRLSETTPNEATYQTLITEIATLTGIQSVTLCLMQASAQQATQVFSTYPRSIAMPPFCSYPNCGRCLDDSITHQIDDSRFVLSIPIKDQEQQFGVLIIHSTYPESVAAWQLPLLEAIAHHIAATLRANEKIEQHQQLELLEERNTIARELHDSLAQSLSYLKIQVSHLNTLLKPLGITAETYGIITDLREGLNRAYRQLRELIATFRLKMEHSRLEDSLKEIVREFSQRGQLPITLDCTNWRHTLKPNEQIHAIHIVQEALNNAVKHAQARRITVRLFSTDDDSNAIIEIHDDGIGLPVHPERKDHFGLSIMRERAAYLSGTLNLDSQPAQGLRVQIKFPLSATRGTASTPPLEKHYV